MIIGFAAEARSGKSEAAYICETMFGFKQQSFAEPLRNFAIDFLNLSGLEELDKIKEIPHHLLGGKTPRYAMQTMGTEWGREMIDQDLWVNRCIQMCHNYENSVISDVRFENEAKAIIENGGRIIRIVRGHPKIKESSHVSENGIDNKYIYGIIDNTGTLYEFRQQVYMAVDKILRE